MTNYHRNIEILMTELFKVVNNILSQLMGNVLTIRGKP